MPRKLALIAAAALALAVTDAALSGGAREPRGAANNPFKSSLISECVRAKRPQRVRALVFDGAQLPASVAAGHEPGTRPRCRPGELRLLRFEALRIDGERTYVRRGGCALPCVVRQATVHVAASTFVRPVSLLPRSARNGNGEPAADCFEEVRNAPQLVEPGLQRMYYKTPDELRRRRNAGRSGGAGARWSNYGNPGATYRSAGARRTSYNYLLWNLPRTSSGLLPGGGIIRAILREGQPIALCRGERLRLASFDRRGAPNGTLSFAYGKVRAARAIYGWVLAGYQHGERPFTSTLEWPGVEPTPRWQRTPGAPPGNAETATPRRRRAAPSGGA